MGILTTDQGYEHLLIKKGRADKSLQHRDACHDRHVVADTFQDDYRLAQKPYEWVTDAAHTLFSKLPDAQWESNIEDLRQAWEKSVLLHVKTAEREIAKAIVDHACLGATPPKVSIYIIGRGDVKVLACPLPCCFGECVPYQPVEPEAFQTTLLERLKRVPPINGCNHRIPVPRTARVILGNYLDIYTRRR